MGCCLFVKKLMELVKNFNRIGEIFQYGVHEKYKMIGNAINHKGLIQVLFIGFRLD